MRGSVSRMSDGELILVAAALLAAGIGASLLASRIRLPGLLLFLALGMAIGSDGLGWIDFNDYELARTIGVVALALILFEGGLTAGFHEIRPVLRPSLSLAIVGTIGTAVDLRLRGGLAVRPLARSRACCSARSSPPPTAPRSSRSCASRRCGAGSRARSRARPASTTRWPCCSWSASSSGSSSRTTASLDLLLLFVAPRWGSARWSGWASAGWRCMACATRSSPARASTRSRRWPPPALAFGGADDAARLGLPRRLPGRPGARLGAHPGQADDRRSSTRGSPGSRRSRCSSRSGCSSSPASSTTSGWRAPRSRSCSCSSRARSPRLSRPRSSASRRGERIVLGWAGLRGAVPVVLATFPVIEGVDPEPRVLQHRLLRRRALDAAPGHDRRVARPQARRDHERARAAAPAHGDRHGAAPGRGDRGVPGGRRRRDRRAARARAGAAARRPAQRDRARRGGAAAARLHAHRGRRPAARDGARGGGGRHARAARALAHRAGRAPHAAARAPARRHCGVHHAPLDARRTATRASQGGGRRGGGRADAHPPRHARRARGARGRALRGHRPAAWPSAGRSSSSATRAGGWSTEDDAAARAWWQEVIGALAR